MTIEDKGCDDVVDLFPEPTPVFAVSTALITAPIEGSPLLLKGWASSTEGAASAVPETTPDLAAYLAITPIDGELALRTVQSGTFTFQVLDANSGAASEARTIDVEVPAPMQIGCACRGSGLRAPGALAVLAALWVRRRRRIRRHAATAPGRHW